MFQLADMPLRTSLPFTFLFTKHSHSFLKPYFLIHMSAPNNLSKITSTNLSAVSDWRTYSDSSASWLSKWSRPSYQVASMRTDVVKSAEKHEVIPAEADYFDKNRGGGAIQRIVLRLRNLGLDDEGDEEERNELKGDKSVPLKGNEKLGDLLQRDWVRPDKIQVMNGEAEDILLPWERVEDQRSAAVPGERLRKRAVKAPTLAELTIEDEQLRRLRRRGMEMRERINVPKAGTTSAILEQIHDVWRKDELVKLKFHEFLARDMKKAHEMVERRSGGLVIWRSGSAMVVFRGNNYTGPSSINLRVDGKKDDMPFVPDVSSADNLTTRNAIDESSTLKKCNVSPVRRIITEEEAEYNRILDDLGPRFTDWWGTGSLPVDADLLPPLIPGYKTPRRLLPAGMRSGLTNKEMTVLRRFSRPLPSHFALGRNRGHQGLAVAIRKLWEKSLIVKIAIKPGVLNTNSTLMSDELMYLTGGVLLMRDRHYIVIYRGKDFLSTSVSAALDERQKLTKEIQSNEEKIRNEVKPMSPSGKDQSPALAGTLAEFYEAEARWGRETSLEEQKKLIEEASRAKNAKIFQQMKRKLAVGYDKMYRAQKLLAKIETSMVPIAPSDDKETLSKEEKFMFRRVGLKMKAYLPLGIRGIFDGVIENMHLHWKHRELVKLISKQKTLAFIEGTARLLEYESGGILVSIDQIPKGFLLIYYRGKNYRRPLTLRPRNLLTKAKALKRSIAMQRHEGLSKHILELENKLEKMKVEFGIIDDAEY